MTKETFMETLKTRYGEEIQGAYAEWAHKTRVDFSVLNEQLRILMEASHLEGLPEKEFEDLLKITLPEAIMGKVEILPHLAHNHSVRRKAA